MSSYDGSAAMMETSGQRGNTLPRIHAGRGLPIDREKASVPLQYSYCVVRLRHCISMACWLLRSCPFIEVCTQLSCSCTVVLPRLRWLVTLGRTAKPCRHEDAPYSDCTAQAVSVLATNPQLPNITHITALFQPIYGDVHSLQCHTCGHAVQLSTPSPIGLASRAERARGCRWWW